MVNEYYADPDTVMEMIDAEGSTPEVAGDD
jgi:hypothetical protein